MAVAGVGGGEARRRPGSDGVGAQVDFEGADFATLSAMGASMVMVGMACLEREGLGGDVEAAGRLGSSGGMLASTSREPVEDVPGGSGPASRRR